MSAVRDLPRDDRRLSALGLTAAEHRALADLMDDSGREREGNEEPWERMWLKAWDSTAGRVYASLARKGLIEKREGRASAKIAPYYRWRREP